jgi:hypothetical protein
MDLNIFPPGSCCYPNGRNPTPAASKKARSKSPAFSRQPVFLAAHLALEVVTAIGLGESAEIQ